MGPSMTDWLTLGAGALILVAAAIAILYTFVWVAKLLYTLATNRPRLVPLARLDLVAGQPGRLAYSPANGASHWLWLEIEAAWSGPYEWKADVSLRLSGAAESPEAHFPIGEDDDENDIRSPHVGYGTTAVNSRSAKMLSRRRVQTTVKVFPVRSTPPGSTIVVDAIVTPASYIGEFRVALVAADDPPAT